MRTCLKLKDSGAVGLEPDHFGNIDEPLLTMPLHFVVGLNHPRADKIMQDFNAALWGNARQR